MNETERREQIMEEIRGAVLDLIYCNRREDEAMPVGSIEKAIKNGEITIIDMADHFREALEKYT